jgi:hypothetical protein
LAISTKHAVPRYAVFSTLLPLHKLVIKHYKFIFIPMIILGVGLVWTFLTATLHKSEKYEENNRDLKVHSFKVDYTVAS